MTVRRLWRSRSELWIFACKLVIVSLSSTTAISLSARSRSLSLILKFSSWAAVGSEKSYFSRELGDELLECSEILAGRSDRDLLRPKVLVFGLSSLLVRFASSFSSAIVPVLVEAGPGTGIGVTVLRLIPREREFFRDIPPLSFSELAIFAGGFKCSSC